MSALARTPALAAALAVALAGPAGADEYDLPPLGGVGDRDCAAAAAPPPPAARAAQGVNVRSTIARYERGGFISSEDAAAFRAAYAEALRVRRRLSGQRRSELSAVIDQLEAFARRGDLTASRLPILFLQLERNAQHWARSGPPVRRGPQPKVRPCTGGTGNPDTRRQFGDDPVVFQWYPGQGLQIQQLATAGKVNALAKACLEPDETEAECDPEQFRRGVDRLVFLAANRGFLAWEYYFAFGGGSPPWISGLAQATAMQALSRGARYFQDPRYLDVARRALGAFRTGPPRGVRVRAGAGNHYLIYSFDSGLRVLNGFLQSLVGLYDYAEAADDDRARALFRAGDRRARQEVPGHDTGAWSLYSAGGNESDLGYHRLLRDFLQSLCDRVQANPYCSTAERFTRYMTERTRLKIHRVTAPRPGRTAVVTFSLSKLSCVTLRVRRDGRLVSTQVRVLGRGTRSLAWVPRRRGEHTVQVQAVDLVSHYTRAERTVRIR
ncbi:MAG TPA: D-glucuronyl C5-epimerase family protein [Solirubrobacteraceae bacterium]|nr:D-glucuronyl C5-epimerase family protein [Solirubrobacteraceae bacterium]